MKTNSVYFCILEPNDADAITTSQLLQHFNNCNTLIEDVDLQAHITKLCALATMIVVNMTDKKRIGLCACYMNDYATRTAYITHIAISPQYRGFGYGKHLLEQTITIATEKGFLQLNLEVLKTNIPALTLYQSHQFTIIEDRNTKYLMSLHLAAKSR